MTSKLVVNTIEADTGISSVSFASSISLSSSSVFHFSDAGVNIGADTNINRPATGVIGFNINSSEKARINSDGKVGLGTTGSDYALSIREADNNNKFLMLQKNSGQQLLQIREDGDNHIIIDGSHASGELHFYTAGSEKLRITSGGNVNIGTGETTQTARMLNVYGGATRVTQTSGGNTIEAFGHTTSGQSYGLLVNAGSTSGDYCANFRNKDATTLLRIRGDGKVGIGTDNPSKQLSIYGDADTCIRVTSSAGGAASLQLGDTSDTVKGAITFLNSDNSLRIRGHNNADRIVITSGGTALFGTTASVNSLRAVFQGYSDGGENFQARIRFQSNQATNLTSGSHIANLLFTNASGSEGARIDVKADANWGTGSYPSRIEFSTTASSANTPTERLRIRSDGKISTGTSINVTNSYEFSVTGSDSNGAIYGHGRNHYLSNRSNAYASLTLKKSNSDSDATDYFQLRDSSNNLKASITGDGNWKPISGGGIDFSAYGNNSGMTSELLDDYEEGAYTPSTNTGLSLNSGYNTFAYIKIGRCCTVRGLFYPNNNPSGNYTMTFSLPFTAYNYPQIAGAGGSGVMYRYISGATAGVAVYVEDGGSIARFYKNGSSNSTWNPVYNSDWNSAMEIYVDFTYFTV